MPDRDLTTATGAREWLAELRTDAADRFRRDGDHPAMAWFVVTRDERSCQSLPEPALLGVYVASDIINDHGGAKKDRLAIWLRRIAVRGDAIGFAFISEAWRLSNTDIRPRGSWEHVAGRIESLTLFGEHYALDGKSVIAHAAITRSKRGAPKLGPWAVREDVQARGRFMGVLRTPDETKQLEDGLRILIESGRNLSPELRRFLIEHACQRAGEDSGDAAEANRMKMYVIARSEELGLPVAPRLEDKQPVNDPDPVVILEKEVP